MKFARLRSKNLAFFVAVAGIAVVASLGVVTSLAPAMAQGGDPELAAQVDLPDVAPPGMFDPPTAAEMRDLATVAEANGISLEEAVATRGWRRGFSQLVQQIASGNPESFAGAAIEQNGSTWIAFKGAIPAGVDTLVEQFEREVLEPRAWSTRIDLVPNRGFSERELNDRVIAAHQAVYDRSPLVSDVSTEADPRTGEIQVVVRSVGQDLARTAADVKSRLPADVSVRVTSSALGGDDATHKGGQPMSTCTSGFSVFSSTMTGMATAAHCGDLQSMNGVTLVFKAAHNGTYGDMQWHHKSGETFADDFLAGNATTWNYDNRDVSGTGSPVVGLDVCKNGKNGYKDCDEVKALGHCFNGACNLVRVYERQAEPGDSGGPWFWGNTAYGLHKGYNLHDWAYRDLFTRADYSGLGLGLGVTVRQ